ncbi:Insulinase (Peptidase M16) [Clydaea vesicula]|uniref:Insulinase (Peptidase M16) n=1 Tax=Clydaea vesicula TaxID=447962 RepID=A0AAD5TYA7_9FUNG|nr:Insulinase (Peptidase M16) [Clydaea vesicula]
MLVSQSFDSTNWQKARYYGTEYKLCEFSDSLKKRLNDNSTIDAEIHLPHINDFVPSNFEVEKPLREKVADYAELIMDTDKVRLWHKKDDTFFVPKAYTRFLLRSPLAYATPLQAVKCELYHKLLVDELNELSYFADIAGLKYDFTNTSDGMMLTVEGYNHKLGVLLQKVSEHLKNLEVKPERFNLIKEKLTRSLKNFKFNEPYHLSGYYISYVSQDFVWTYEEKLDCIDQIDVNSLNALIKEMYNNSHIEGFVHGNIDKEESIKLVEILTSALGFRPLPSLIRFSTSRSHILPQGSNTIFKECAGNPENLNSSIEYYIEIGDYDDVTLKAKSSLFSTIMTEPCFDQMRTKEQLGYIVFGGSRNQKGRLGYRILIQSEREAIFLETRVEAFIRKMECILNDLTETEFQKFIDVTVAQLLEKDKNLKQEFSRLWSHIKNHYYDFHRRKLEVEILKKLTKQEIIDFYKEYISIESKNRRKLSAWIESQVKKEEICKNNYSEEEKKEIQKILEKNVILVGLENVANFKKGLRLEKSPMPVQGVWMSKL